MNTLKSLMIDIKLDASQRKSNWPIICLTFEIRKNILINVVIFPYIHVSILPSVLILHGGSFFD